MARRSEQQKHDEVEELAQSYVDLRYQRDDCAASMKDVRDQILNTMDSLGVSDLKAGTYSVVVAQPRSASLDEEELREEIGDEMWERITTRSLDRNKLDAFIKSGEIDPDVVADCTTTTYGTPSLRVTVKK